MAPVMGLTVIMALGGADLAEKKGMMMMTNANDNVDDMTLKIPMKREVEGGEGKEAEDEVEDEDDEDNDDDHDDDDDDADTHDDDAEEEEGNKKRINRRGRGKE